MGFRLVPTSVTLNDLERRNGFYFALFHRIRQLSWPGPLPLYVKVEMSYSTPTKHDGRAVLFAVAELLVVASQQIGVLSSIHTQQANYLRQGCYVMSGVCPSVLLSVCQQLYVTRCSAIAERARCRVRYSFRQKQKTETGRQYFTDIIGLSSTTVI